MPSAVGALLRVASSYPLLDQFSEIRLGRQIREGRQAEARYETGTVPSSRVRQTIERGHQARERMILSNILLVASIAGHYQNRVDLPFEDLLHEGLVGLCEAVDRFDPDRGCRFSTMAWHWIRRSILRACDRRGRLVRLPFYLVQILGELRDLRTRLASGRQVTDADLAEAMGEEVSRIQFLEGLTLPAVSLDSPACPSEKLAGWARTMGRRQVEAMEDQVLFGEVRSAMQHLDSRERLILVERFGLEGGGERTLEEIGHELGISRERVRQIEAQALRRLQRLLAERC